MWGLDAHQDVQFLAQLLAVCVEGEIVDVVSKGILEFVSDGCQTHDDVGCGQSTRDCDPAEGGEELEGEDVDVEKDDLGDQDVVTNGKRGGEDTFGIGLGIAQGGETNDYYPG